MEDNKSLEIQQQVRVNAQKIQEEFASLKTFENEIKQKEKDFLDGNSKNLATHDKIPIRSSFDYYLEANKKEENINAAEVKVIEDKKGKDEANQFKEKGNSFVKQKKYEAAIEMYSKAIEICPDEAVYYSNRSQCYLSLEKYKECIEDASVAIKIDPHSTKSFYRRMVAYEKLNEDMKALKDCQELMSALPDDQTAKIAYDRIHNKLFENARNKEKEKIKWSRSLEETHFIDKPLHSQSKKSLRKIEVRTKKSHSPIPDDVIDKIFNNNTGEHTAIRFDKDSKLFKPNFLEKSYVKPETIATKTKDKVDETNQQILEASNKKQRIPSLQDLETAAINLVNLPSTGPQFYTAWKELNEGQRFIYLKKISENGINLGKLLGAQLESCMLSEIINVIYKYFTHFNIPYIQTIFELSKNSELSILAMFLETDDKDKLRELLNLLKVDNDKNNMIHQITQNFQL